MAEKKIPFRKREVQKPKPWDTWSLDKMLKFYFHLVDYDINEHEEEQLTSTDLEEFENLKMEHNDHEKKFEKWKKSIDKLTETNLDHTDTGNEANDKIKDLKEFEKICKHYSVRPMSQDIYDDNRGYHDWTNALFEGLVESLMDNIEDHNDYEHNDTLLCRVFKVSMKHWKDHMFITLVT